KSVGHWVHARSELAPFSERKLIDHAADVDELDIETRGTALRREIADILRISFVVAGVVFQRLLGIAQRFRPGEGIKEIQPSSETMSHADRETVVIVIARWIEPRDGPKGLNGTPRLNAQRLTGKIRVSLIVVGDNRQPQTVIPVVGKFYKGIFGQLALDREQPRLNVRPFSIRGNIVDVGNERVEVGGIVNTCRETVLRSEEGGRRRAAGGNRLRQNPEQSLRSVDPFLRASGPVEERITDAVSSAQDGFGIQAISQAQARTEILVIGMNQSAIIDAAARRLDQSVGGGIEVRPVVIPLPNRRREFPTKSEVQRKLRIHAEVVLEVQSVDVLAKVRDEFVPELNRAGKSEDEVGKIVAGGIALNAATGGH